MMKWATKHRDDSAHFSVQILFFTFLIGIAVVTPISFVFPDHKNGKKKMTNLRVKGISLLSLNWSMYEKWDASLFISTWVANRIVLERLSQYSSNIKRERKKESNFSSLKIRKIFFSLRPTKTNRLFIIQTDFSFHFFSTVKNRSDPDTDECDLLTTINHIK